MHMMYSESQVEGIPNAVRNLSRKSSDTSLSSRYSQQLEDLTSLMLAVPAESENIQPEGPSGYTVTTSSLPSGSRKRKMHPTEVPLHNSKFARTGSGEASPSQDSSDTSQPEIIADSPAHRGYLGDLPWAVQWEIARYVSVGLDYKDIEISQLCDLQVSEDPLEVKVSQIAEMARKCSGKQSETVGKEQFVSAFRRETEAKSPWEEIEREEAAIHEHHAHIRNCTTKDCKKHSLYLQDRDWYGGKVHFTGQLRIAVDKDKGVRAAKIELNRPYLSTSNRFSRRFGSSAFVRIQIERSTVFQHGAFLLDYFRKPFIISGQVFRSVFAKEHNVILYRTNEEAQVLLGPATDSGPIRLYHIHEPKTSDPLSRSLSFLDFLHWHNAIELNNKQTMAKWAARFALGLSNSVPSLEIARDCFERIVDTVSPRHQGSYQDAPTELVMTDGCGLGNANFFKKLQEQFQWSTYPTAVQMRINGAKGLLILHPDHAAVTQDGEARVWIRDSQAKIVYAEDAPYDTALYTTDVLRSSHMASPARLSVETIVNLAENGVPSDMFIELMKISLSEKVDGLTVWNDQDKKFSLLTLWANLAKEGGVFAARLARMAVSAARAQGYVHEDRSMQEDYQDEDEDLDCLDAAATEQSSPWWDDVVSGCPSSLEEIVMQLLDAGFTPDNCAVLRERLKVIAEKALKTYENKYRFAVPMSCSAFIIPDPTGTLAAGEVHIKSSSRNLLGHDGMPTDTVVGPVLLTRHPCKVPTDVQRASAVVKHELRNYVDVIVVSSKGHVVNGQELGCHLASMTGGGDYDGDLMQAFWQPEIVQTFKSADPCFAVEPRELASCLYKTNEKVSDFLNRVPPDMPYWQQIYELQKYLLSSLTNAHLVGTYSTFWQNSIYMNGYFDRRTILLANLFCKILDGAKTGVTIDPARFLRDKKYYGVPRGPSWTETEKAAKNAESTNLLNLKRSRGLGSFIMDILKAEITREVAKQKSIIKTRLANFTKKDYVPDLNLLRPWEEFESEGGNEEAREAIKSHVQSVMEMHNKTCRSKKFTELPIVARQDKLRALSQEFASKPDVRITIGPNGHDLATLKASYSYLCDHRSDGFWTRFPWNMAFRSLCEIKAKAGGPTKTVSTDFYSAFTVKSSFLTRP